MEAEDVSGIDLLKNPGRARRSLEEPRFRFQYAQSVCTIGDTTRHTMDTIRDTARDTQWTHTIRHAIRHQVRLTFGQIQ